MDHSTPTPPTFLDLGMMLHKAISQNHLDKIDIVHSIHRDGAAAYRTQEQINSIAACVKAVTLAAQNHQISDLSLLANAIEMCTSSIDRFGEGYAVFYNARLDFLRECGYADFINTHKTKIFNEIFSVLGAQTITGAPATLAQLDHINHADQDFRVEVKRLFNDVFFMAGGEKLNGPSSGHDGQPSRSSTHKVFFNAATRLIDRLSITHDDQKRDRLLDLERQLSLELEEKQREFFDRDDFWQNLIAAGPRFVLKQAVMLIEATRSADFVIETGQDAETSSPLIIADGSTLADRLDHRRQEKSPAPPSPHP